MTRARNAPSQERRRRWPPSLYGYEVLPSIFGGGFDVWRHTRAREDDEAEHEIVATKGTIKEANAAAGGHFRVTYGIWKSFPRGAPPTLKLMGGEDVGNA